MKYRWLNLCWALLPVSPALLSAQLAVGGDVVVRSAQVWRGVTRSSRPVLQPSLFAAWQPYGWILTAGVWSSSELAALQFGDLTDAGSGRHHAELNYWFEAHTRRRGIDLRLGTVRYDLRGDPRLGGRGNAFDTGELYGAALIPITELTLAGGSIAYDYDAVRGSYLGAQALQHVPLLAVHSMMSSLLLTVDAGFSLGQEANVERPAESAHFSERGLTHVALSTALRVTVERAGAFVSGHFQFNEDAATRRTGLDETSWRKSWVEAGAWLLLGPPAREQR